MRRSLKYALEDTSHHWTNYIVDAGHGEEIGLFARMILDGNNARPRSRTSRSATTTAWAIA